LEQLTPGELRLLAALDDDVLPDVPLTPDIEQMQRRYAGQVIAQITAPLLCPEAPGDTAKPADDSREYPEMPHTYAVRPTPPWAYGSAPMPHPGIHNTGDDT
jgi:hypothetical protein